MPHQQERRRITPRESDRRAHEVLSMRAAVDHLQTDVKTAIFEQVRERRLDPDVLEAMNRLEKQRRELWEGVGEYFAALRSELEAMIGEEREVSVPAPVPEADARFARH